MAIIHAHGLFEGERLQACSDQARLYWPYFFAASNSCARLEIDIQAIIERAFRKFKLPPTRDQVSGWLKEYLANYLLFIYVAPEGSTWGQWDVRKEDLPRWTTRDAKRSPEPPTEAFTAWKKEYEDTKRQRSHALSEEFTRKRASAHGNALGIGVGIGVGIGIGSRGGSSPRKEARESPPLTPIPVFLAIEEPPDDIGSTQLAKGLLEELEVPSTVALVDVVRLSVEAKAKTCGGLGKACSYILAQAREAKINGPPKWKFWFQDAQYDAKPGGNGKNGHSRQQEPAHNGDPNCSRCQGTGLRGSYSAPGRSVECECVSALLEGDGAGGERGPHLLETKGPA